MTPSRMHTLTFLVDLSCMHTITVKESIPSLVFFADVKRLPKVEHATGGTHQLIDAEEDASSTPTSVKTTTASSLPDLVDSFKIFDLD